MDSQLNDSELTKIRVVVSRPGKRYSPRNSSDCIERANTKVDSFARIPRWDRIASELRELIVQLGKDGQ